MLSEEELIALFGYTLGIHPHISSIFGKSPVWVLRAPPDGDMLTWGPDRSKLIHIALVEIGIRNDE